MYTGKWRVLGNNIQIQFWQNATDVIYSIHMPIFTLISGYLRFILECFLITRLMDKCFLGRPFILLIFVIFQYLFFDVLEYHTLDIPFDTNYRYFIL